MSLINPVFSFKNESKLVRYHVVKLGLWVSKFTQKYFTVTEPMLNIVEFRSSSKSWISLMTTHALQLIKLGLIRMKFIFIYTYIYRKSKIFFSTKEKTFLVVVAAHTYLIPARKIASNFLLLIKDRYRMVLILQ